LHQDRDHNQHQRVNATDSRIGSTLAERYLLTELLGAGGMGAVYKATHLQLDTVVAVKLLNAAALSMAGENDGVVLKRLRQEGQILGGLKHPLIPSVHCIEQSGNDVFIAMDFIDGVPLTNFIEKGNRLAQSELLTVFLQLADVFQYAHDKGIVHRDIKPANVMVTRNGGTGMLRPHVLDFGIAKFSHSSQKLTQTGAFVGTAQYVSPEQAMGARVDRRSDVYSLTCVLYECLSGESVFCADSPYEMLLKHAYDTLPNLNLPELDWISEVLVRGLAKEPNDRFQSMEEFSQALEDAAAAAQIQIVGGGDSRESADSGKSAVSANAASLGKSDKSNKSNRSKNSNNSNNSDKSSKWNQKRSHSKNQALRAGVSLKRLMVAALCCVIALGGFLVFGGFFHKHEEESARGADPILTKKMIQQLSDAAANKRFDDETMKLVKEAEFNYNGVIPDSDRWLMLNQAASVHRSRGDNSEAKRLWVISIKAAHNYKAVGSEPILRLSNTIRETDGGGDEAIAMLERQVAWIKDNNFVDSEEGRTVTYHLASLYAANNRAKDAVKLYDELRNVSPDGLFIWWSRSTLSGAECRAILGETALAKSMVEEWMSRSQNQAMRNIYMPQAYNALGVLSLHDHDYKKARMTFGKALAAADELIASNPEQQGYKRIAGSQRSVTEEGLAGVAECERDDEEALRHAQRAVELAEEAGEALRIQKTKLSKASLVRRMQKRAHTSAIKLGPP
jgi:serine/threonine protein kinase